MSDAIVIENLEKHFGDVKAVDGLDLKVPEGQLFGLLGPNGSGKTTTIKILCGVLKPTSGRAFVGGYEVGRSDGRVKELIGVCPQEDAIYSTLTGRENVELFGKLHSMPSDELRRKADLYLEKMGLADDSRRKAGKYSGGMKKRISIIMAIIHDPDIAFLDEPTAAMDPQSKNVVWDFIRELKAKGKTVVLTTHHMEEAEELCDVVGIIDHGRLIAMGTPKELREAFHEKDLEGVFIQLTGRRIREGA
ncbi:MAG TPA: ABC transporter ATP-binding protein [Conexivisphaerales archaeon]|nr:ABC transporter ATP-binding protein [Conexivisphaerales archaeon]